MALNHGYRWTAPRAGGFLSAGRANSQSTARRSRAHDRPGPDAADAADGYVARSDVLFSGGKRRPLTADARPTPTNASAEPLDVICFDNLFFFPIYYSILKHKKKNVKE